MWEQMVPGRRRSRHGCSEVGASLDGFLGHCGVVLFTLKETGGFWEVLTEVGLPRWYQWSRTHLLMQET